MFVLMTYCVDCEALDGQEWCDLLPVHAEFQLWPARLNHDCLIVIILMAFKLE